MPYVTVPGFGRIFFPDSMSPVEISRALDKMRDDGELDYDRSEYRLPAAGSIDDRQRKRAELDRIGAFGDIGPGSSPGTVDRRPDSSRSDDGTIAGLGHTDVSDTMKHGFWELHGRDRMSASEKYLTDTVLDRGFGWAVGGAERLGLVPEGTRQAIRENQAEAQDEYLTAHPEGELGRAITLSAGDVAASMAGPQAALGVGGGTLAGRLALAKGAEPALARLAGVAGGALEGAAQSWLDNPETPDVYGADEQSLSPEERQARQRERLKSVGIGALLGGLGGAHAVDIPEETRSVVTVDGRSTPTLSHEQYRPTEREIRLGLRPPTLDDARSLAEQSLPIGEQSLKRLQTAARNGSPALVEFADLPDKLGEQAYSQYLSDRQAAEAAVDADLATRAEYGKPLPPDVAARVKAERLTALDESWHARARTAAALADDPSLHALADDTEMSIVWDAKAPARTPPEQLTGRDRVAAIRQQAGKRWIPDQLRRLPYADERLPFPADSPEPWVHGFKIDEPLPLPRIDAAEPGQIQAFNEIGRERTMAAWDVLSRRHPILAAQVRGIEIMLGGWKGEAVGKPGSTRGMMGPDGILYVPVTGVNAETLVHELTHTAQFGRGLLGSESDIFGPKLTHEQAEGYAVRNMEPYRKADVLGDSRRVAAQPHVQDMQAGDLYRYGRSLGGRYDERLNTMRFDDGMPRDLSSVERQRLRYLRNQFQHEWFARPEEEVAAAVKASSADDIPTGSPQEVVRQRASRRVAGDEQSTVTTPAHVGRPSEAGYITLPGSTTPDPGTDPMESVVGYSTAAVKEPVRVKLRRLADRWIDEMSDKEDAPIRTLRRAGLVDESKRLEKYIARARGAARIATQPIFNGVRLFDPVTGNTTRTHDSYSSIVGGLDGLAERDLNNYMAARHHMELIGRRDRALTEYDIRRAYRTEALRQARQVDKESIGRMATDVRSAETAEVRAARAAGRGAGQAEGRLAGEAALRGQQELITARGQHLEDEALLAAEATRETGFDERSAEYAAAAQYARALVADELATARTGDRPGSAVGLTSGDTQVDRLRSPAALRDVDAASRAASRAAERMGLEEGRMRALLAAGRSFDAVAAGLGRAADRQADMAGAAAYRGAVAGTDQAATAGEFRQALTSMRRVVMGIRDQAERLRSQHPPVDMHPDGRLDIDPSGTALAQQTLDDLGRRYAGGLVKVDQAGRRSVTTLEDLSQQVRDWSIAAVVDQLDSIGYFKPGMREAMLRANREYAPFFRLLDDVAGDETLAVTGGTTSQPLRRISGGLSPDKPIAPPLESFVEQAQRIGLFVERQRARNLLGDYAEANPDALPEIVQVKPGQKRPSTGAVGSQTFQVFRDGQRIEYSAPADILQALHHAPRQASYLLQAGVFAARMLRAGATMTPDFAVSNFFRDQASAGAYGAEFKYRPFYDFFAGLLAQTPAGGKLREYVGQWEASGGALSDYISIERPHVAATADSAAGLVSIGGKKYRAPAVAKTFATWKAESNVFAKALWPLLAPVEAVSERVEQATRIGAFRRAKLGGASDLDAGFYSRNITLDFGRSGSLAQRWNSVEAFANASLQDVARFSRAMRERPAATTISALAYLTLPALAAWYRYKDDPAYQGLPEWDKASFVPVAKRDDGRWWRIPRPQGLLNTIFSYGAVKMFEAAEQDGHGPAVKQLLANLFQETPLRYSPLQPGQSEFEGPRMSLEAAPSALQPVFEAAAGEGGYSSYRGDEIVPRGLQGALPEDQALDQTTATARALGRRLEVSPLKIDYLIRGYGAALAWGALNSAEKLAGVKTDTEPPLPTTLKDVPGVARLISSPSYGFASQPVVDFYQLADASERAATSLKMAGRQSRVADYQRILREHPEGMPVVVGRLRSARQTLKELRMRRKEYRTAAGLDPATRADNLLAIDMQITQLAAGYMHWASDYLHGFRDGRPATVTSAADGN